MKKWESSHLSDLPIDILRHISNTLTCYELNAVLLINKKLNKSIECILIDRIKNFILLNKCKCKTYYFFVKDLCGMWKDNVLTYLHNLLLKEDLYENFSTIDVGSQVEFLLHRFDTYKINFEQLNWNDRTYIKQTVQCLEELLTSDSLQISSYRESYAIILNAFDRDQKDTSVIHLFVSALEFHTFMKKAEYALKTLSTPPSNLFNVRFTISDSAVYLKVKCASYKLRFQFNKK